MSSNNTNRVSTISSEKRMLLSLTIAVVILLAAGLGALLIIRPSPPFPSPTLAPDDPTPAPPPTFTPLASSTPKMPPGPTPTYTPTTTPTPIPVGWNKLGYLTAIEIVGKTIVEEKGKKSIWGTDWVLLEVVGKVQVSVDMTQIRDQDVVVDGVSVEVILPAPNVTSVELLPNQTQAYIDQTKVFFSEFSDLQLQALEKGRTDLRSWIMNNESWMSLAKELTKRRLEAFLRQLGFEDIKIVFRETAIR